ncbi:DUF2218 domain-containing protein [Acinetobacter puyangensis]|uniref:DUF2218 domain-containing protein n=1 Tax=Acinetobacter puyangensis TaxID=1096779 RepID=A0A240E7Q4_9GAMM|nr:DUF2218 domain-containing protein [Acinetobacter puyangensis]SNX44273.1 hypothetical protein/cytochrome b561 [Acinetobacter puyangensis]
MNKISELRIDTVNAEKIIKKLTNHWRHKMAIEQYNDTFKIPFSKEINVFLTAYPDHLAAKVESENHEQLIETENVVLSHLNRMAQQEFAATWIRLES